MRYTGESGWPRGLSRHRSRSWPPRGVYGDVCRWGYSVPLILDRSIVQNGYGMLLLPSHTVRGSILTKLLNLAVGLGLGYTLCGWVGGVEFPPTRL